MGDDSDSPHFRKPMRKISTGRGNEHEILACDKSTKSQQWNQGRRTNSKTGADGVETGGAERGSHKHEIKTPLGVAVGQRRHRIRQLL